MDPKDSAARGGFGEERYEKLEFQRQVKYGAKLIIAHESMESLREGLRPKNRFDKFQAQNGSYEGFWLLARPLKPSSGVGPFPIVTDLEPQAGAVARCCLPAPGT